MQMKGLTVNTAAVCFIMTGSVMAAIIAVKMQRPVVIVTRHGTAAIAETVLIMKMISAMNAAAVWKAAVTVIIAVTIAVKNPMLCAKAAGKNAVNVKRTRCVLIVRNTARTVLGLSTAGVIRVSWAAAVPLYVRTVRMPVRNVHICVTTVDIASITSAASAMTGAAAAVRKATTSAMAVVTCAANVHLKKSVRTAENTAPTVWTSSVRTVVWAAAA